MEVSLTGKFRLLVLLISFWQSLVFVETLDNGLAKTPPSKCWERSIVYFLVISFESGTLLLSHDFQLANIMFIPSIFLYYE